MATPVDLDAAVTSAAEARRKWVQAIALYALIERAAEDSLDFSGVMKLIDGSL